MADKANGRVTGDCALPVEQPPFFGASGSDVSMGSSSIMITPLPSGSGSGWALSDEVSPPASGLFMSWAISIKSDLISEDVSLLMSSGSGSTTYSSIGFWNSQTGGDGSFFLMQSALPDVGFDPQKTKSLYVSSLASLLQSNVRVSPCSHQVRTEPSQHPPVGIPGQSG